MSDYPDPDEEYELMYADELEMMREQEEETDTVVRSKILPAKRSLNFSSPTSKEPSKDDNSLSQSIQPLPCSQEPITPNVIKEKSQDVFTNEALTTLSNIGPSKRTVDDLFGDIGDINFDDIELPSKRQKTEEENDQDLINKILEGRRLKQLLHEPSKSDTHSSKPGYTVKDNISLDIPSWAFIPLTNSDGDRIYVKLESEEFWEASLDSTMENVTLRSMYADAWEEARQLLETKQTNQLLLPSQTPMTIVDDALWVDKYRPNSYVDLLSDEPVNRALLHWLHLWDKVVFKKEIKTKEPQQRNSFSKRTGNFQLTNKWKGKREAEAEMDEDGRPRLKVALLCGPPGVGKTTLAHLLAKLAGYRPVELNASDERSVDAFRTALQSATQMRSVLDADKRPNCLILDEIDGAPIATVELLVKWCTATVEATSGKKKGKSHPLRRPVIAICNDLYATSLRPLRPVSLIVQVSGVSTQRLASRVSSVAQCEGVWCAPHVCTALAARVNGDVRAAIHLLSFLKARAKKQLTMEDVENAAIGTKDCNKSMMQALQAIFTINDRDSTDILKVIQSAGEYDRLADGIFENYPTSRVDSRLQIACETLSWLCLHDHISAWTQRNQNYTVYSALPLCLARCHTVLASRTPIRVKFPTQAQEMYRRQQELSSVFWSVRRGCLQRAAAPRSELARDLLPLLPHVLTLHLRSPNVQLCSENERKALRSCAGALCDYGLQYVQQRTPDGLYAFVIEPDVYKYAFFGNEEKCRPPPAIRQAIAREQQLENIRRNEQMSNRVSNKSKNNEKNTVSNDNEIAKNTDSKENGDTKEVRLPNHLQRLKPKAVEKSTPQVHKDFFGRIVPISQVQRADAVPDVISSSSVFYQYREGFNNAVRRNVRTKDLL